MQTTPLQSPSHCSSCAFNVAKLAAHCDANAIELIFNAAPVGVFYGRTYGRKLLIVNLEIRPHRTLELAFAAVGIPLGLMSNVAY